MLKALEISTLTNPEKKIDIFLGLTTYGALNRKNCYYIVSTSRPVKFCPRSCSENLIRDCFHVNFQNS